jgi:hypothetical protein
MSQCAHKAPFLRGSNERGRKSSIEEIAKLFEDFPLDRQRIPQRSAAPLACAKACSAAQDLRSVRHLRCGDRPAVAIGGFRADNPRLGQRSAHTGREKSWAVVSIISARKAQSWYPGRPRPTCTSRKRIGSGRSRRRENDQSRAHDKVNKLTKPSKHEPPSRSRRARVDGSVDDAGGVI